jgi:hypothetical protein
MSQVNLFFLVFIINNWAYDGITSVYVRRLYDIV